MLRAAERLDAAAPGFEKDFSAFLGRNRDTDENVDRVVADIIADVRAPRRCGGRRLHAEVRQGRHRRRGPAHLRCRATRRGGQGAAGAARGARLRRPAHRGLPSRAAAQGRRLHRRHRHAARRALSAARVGRRLRARRHGGLSVLGADEHRAGQGGGRAAHRHGRADAGRRAQSAGHAGGRDRRRRRGLAHRRRPGGGRAGLRHAIDRGRSTRSPARATPMSPPPSAACSARSAST